MTLYKNEIIVAIEQVVEQQVEASGITAELHRLDGEKIVDAIMEKLEGFVLVKMDDLELLRDSALTIKYASLNNDSDRIFSDIEDIQLSIERLIEAQEQSHD